MDLTRRAFLNTLFTAVLMAGGVVLGGCRYPINIDPPIYSARSALTVYWGATEHANHLPHGIRITIMETNLMEPLLTVGDWVVVDADTPPGLGTVIAYRADVGGTVPYIHRVTTVMDDAVIVGADAAPRGTFKWTVTPEIFIGSVVAIYTCREYRDLA